MPKKMIKVLTVNWYSCNYLDHLFSNLTSKAELKDQLTFLILDNTNGNDKKLVLLAEKYPTQVIKNAAKSKGSRAHALGLNLLMEQIDTEYALIVDPDIHVFKHKWDRFLLNLIKEKSVVAVGTAYPPWQLGKYHNFPNPIFCFIKTDEYRKLSPDWTPFEYSKLITAWDFLRRNMLRLGILVNRGIFEKHILIRKIWIALEKVFGLCSKDTGWRIAKNAKINCVNSVIFEAVLGQSIPSDSPYCIIAKDFELYSYNDEPILAHKYSTNSIIWKTQKGNSLEHWNNCITKIDG